MQRPSQQQSQVRWALRRADQAVVAALLAFGLATLALYGLRHVSERQRLVEVDRAERLSAQFIVDVNEADWPELTQIPGIGETLARRIVEYRQQHGDYGDLNELMQIQGIGPRTLERMRPFLLPLADRQMVAGP